MNDTAAGDSTKAKDFVGRALDTGCGPGFYNFDTSLFKSFVMGGDRSLQFRLETFNTLNHPMFGDPGQLNFTTSGFIKITGERTNNGNTGARIVQLPLKLFFYPQTLVAD